MPKKMFKQKIQKEKQKLPKYLNKKPLHKLTLNETKQIANFRIPKLERKINALVKAIKEGKVKDKEIALKVLNKLARERLALKNLLKAEQKETNIVRAQAMKAKQMQLERKLVKDKTELERKKPKTILGKITAKMFGKQRILEYGEKELKEREEYKKAKELEERRKIWKKKDEMEKVRKIINVLKERGISERIINEFEKQISALKGPNVGNKINELYKLYFNELKIQRMPEKEALEIMEMIRKGETKKIKRTFAKKKITRELLKKLVILATTASLVFSSIPKTHAQTIEPKAQIVQKIEAEKTNEEEKKKIKEIQKKVKKNTIKEKRYEIEWSKTHFLAVNGDNIEKRHINNAKNAIDTAKHLGAAETIKAGNTPKEVLEKIEYLGEHTKVGDTVFIYITGHGSQNEFIMNYGTLEYYKLLETMKEHLNGRNIVFVSDACFSGNFARKLYEERKNFGKVFAMSPGLKDEEVSCSFFANTFWDSLKKGIDLDKDGLVSFEEIFDVALKNYRKFRPNTYGTYLESLKEINSISSVKNGIVLIGTSWCPHCKNMENTLQKFRLISKGSTQMYYADGEELPDKEISKYNIEAYPTVLIFENGKLTKKILGYYNLKSFLKKSGFNKKFPELVNPNAIIEAGENIENIFDLFSYSELKNKLTEDNWKRIQKYVKEQIGIAQADKEFINKLIKIMAENPEDIKNIFSSLKKIIEHKNSPILYNAIKYIVRNTKGRETSWAFEMLDALLKNKNFSPIILDSIMYIVKNTKGWETTGAFETLDALLKSKSFKREWINNQKILIKPIIRITKYIIKNTKEEETRKTFDALKSLFNNASFKVEWLRNTKTLIKPIIRTTKYIIRKTKEEETKDVFNALNSLLQNKNLNPKLLNSIMYIAKYTKRKEILFAFNALNALLERENFEQEWIGKYWRPIFKYIVRNTKNRTKKYAFEALNSLLQNKNFKIEWLRKPEILIKPIRRTTKYIVRNTKHIHMHTNYAFNVLESILKNKNLAPELLESVMYVAKNIKGEAIGFVLNALNSLLENKNFTPELLESIVDITKNTKEGNTYWILDALDSILQNKNFNPKLLDHLISIIKNTKREETWAALDILHNILQNRSFKKEWINKPEILVEKIITIIKDITNNTKDDKKYAILKALNDLLWHRKFTPKVLDSIKYIAKNTKEEETYWSFDALTNLLLNYNFNSKVLDSVMYIAKNTKGRETHKAFKLLDSILKNEYFKSELLKDIIDICKNNKGENLIQKLKELEYKIK